MKACKRIQERRRIGSALRKQGYQLRLPINGDRLYRIYKGVNHVASLFWNGESWRLTNGANPAHYEMIQQAIEEMPYGPAS